MSPRLDNDTKSLYRKKNMLVAALEASSDGILVSDGYAIYSYRHRKL